MLPYCAPPMHQKTSMSSSSGRIGPILLTKRIVSCLATVVRQFTFAASSIHLRLVSAQILPSRLSLPITLRDLCTTYLDITAVPRRTFFEFCRNFCEDEREREKMEEFCTPAGQVEHFSFILQVQPDFCFARMSYILIVKDHGGRYSKSLASLDQYEFRLTTS